MREDLAMTTMRWAKMRARGEIMAQAVVAGAKAFAKGSVRKKPWG